MKVDRDKLKNRLKKLGLDGFSFKTALAKGKGQKRGKTHLFLTERNINRNMYNAE